MLAQISFWRKAAKEAKGDIEMPGDFLTVWGMSGGFLVILGALLLLIVMISISKE